MYEEQKRQLIAVLSESLATGRPIMNGGVEAEAKEQESCLAYVLAYAHRYGVQPEPLPTVVLVESNWPYAALPAGEYWVAMDAVDGWYAYRGKPEEGGQRWLASGINRAVRIGRPSDTPAPNGWRNSLRHVRVV